MQFCLINFELHHTILQTIIQDFTISHCLLSHPPSVDTISYDKHSVFTGCNSDCFCSASDWDPICAENGITYVSPCLAGCTSSAGSGKNTVSYEGIKTKNDMILCSFHMARCFSRFWECVTLCVSCMYRLYQYPDVHTCVCVCMSLQVFSNCSCVGVAGNFTARTGQCLHTDDCDRMFPFFLALSVITSFIISLGGTPGYMILIRLD